MKPQIIPATPQDETTLRNLFQFYLYEFSRFTGWPTNYAGRFTEADLEGCWTNPQRHTYLIKAEDALAGFAIIDALPRSRYDEAPSPLQTTAMSEFFIMGAFQNKGLGAHSATQLFDRYPGRWEVYQMQANQNALKFWRRVITRYTQGQYKEVSISKPAGTVQFFDNSGDWSLGF